MTRDECLIQNKFGRKNPNPARYPAQKGRFSSFTDHRTHSSGSSHTHTAHSTFQRGKANIRSTPLKSGSSQFSKDRFKVGTPPSSVEMKTANHKNQYLGLRRRNNIAREEVLGSNGSSASLESS